MISKENQYRIQEDASIAVDALASLMYASNLNENYIKEKVKVAERCLEFIKSFTKNK